ncbi:hypothetical protein TNCV_4922321 [Trichonephila clavipes]|nr:hypothetical protein TNCV_4922321 [Trichonephila clavipes]
MAVFAVEKAFCIKQNVTEATFLDMLILADATVARQHIDNFILQLDGAIPHWPANVRDCLDEQLPQR